MFSPLHLNTSPLQPTNAQSCLQTTWTVAHEGPLSMGFFQTRTLEWVAISSSRSAPHSSSESLDFSCGVPDVCSRSLHWGHSVKLRGRQGVCNRMQQWFEHPPLPFHLIKDILNEQIIYSHGAQQKHFQHCTHWSKTTLWKQSVFQGESKPTATAQEKIISVVFFNISLMRSRL